MALLDAGRLDPAHGVRLAYINPNGGGDVLPTLSAYLQALPAGFRSSSARSTESRVFCVAEGSGTAYIADEPHHWQENDVFVVPNWTPLRLECTPRSVLFSFSDGAALRNLGLLREETVNF